MRLIRSEPLGLSRFDREPLLRREAGLTAPTDIVEYEDAFLLRLDVPGIPSDAIDVQSEKSVLTISGGRPDRADEESARIARQERATGRFERSFRLPVTADLSDIRAQARDGVLEVRIAKREESKARKIDVEAA